MKFFLKEFLNKKFQISKKKGGIHKRGGVSIALPSDTEHWYDACERWPGKRFFVLGVINGILPHKKKDMFRNNKMKYYVILDQCYWSYPPSKFTPWWWENARRRKRRGNVFKQNLNNVTGFWSNFPLISSKFRWSEMKLRLISEGNVRQGLVLSP